MIELIEKVISLTERVLKLGLLLSQIILFGGLGAAYWYRPELVKQYRWWFVLGAVLFEVLVFVIIPMGKWGRGFLGEVWKEHFEKDARQAFATWLRALPSKYRRGAMRRYRQHVIIDHEVFNVRGMGLIAAHVLKLEQVFVDLKIAPASDAARFNPDPIAVKQFANARSVWDFVRASKDASGDAVALSIVGPPGCGKTTLLQHLAVTLAANQQRRYKVPAYTPLLLFLRDHANVIAEQPTLSLGELAQKHFIGERYPDLKLPSDWFERQLQSGKCLVLLDGLDEVAQLEKRRSLSQWADAQLRRYPRCRFVISSRPQGYQDAPLQRANVVEAQPFNGEQIQHFVKNWYLANEVVSAGNQVDEGIRLRASRDADELLRRLANPKAAAIRALTVNPLLLTMITMVHRYRGALPGSRVELYREICEVLLGRWRQAKGVQEGDLTADQKRVVLMPLAAQMMEQEIREIATDDALPIIRPPLKRVGVTSEAAKKFFRDLQESSGLLLEREAGHWGFAHLTFQEYLTAAYWLTEGNRPTDWQQLVGKSWWHETLRLYAAQGDATPILQACLAARSVAALTLAAEIMEEGAREISEDVRHAVEDLLEAALEAEEPELRRLAAEVRLARRISPTRSNSLQSIDDLRELDTQFITCAEYQLFLDEQREQNKYYQPDHWIEPQFPTGQGRAPVCGVLAEDAVAFCDWLTQRQGGAAQYRLPTAEEARQHPISSTQIGYWCQDGESFMLSLSQAQRQAINESLANLFSEAVHLDLDFDLNRNLMRANRDLVGVSARDLASDLDRARNLARNFDYNLDRVRFPDRYLDSALREAASNLIRKSDLDYNLAIRSSLFYRSLLREGVSVNDLLEIAGATTSAERHRAYWQHMNQLLGYVHWGSQLRDLYTSSTSLAASLIHWFKIASPTGKSDKLSRQPQHKSLADAYWWTWIIQARAADSFPAWEGIRIVREQPSTTTART